MSDEGRLLKSGGAWIFDNEIDSIMGEFENGDIVIVHDFDGYGMGRGFINMNSKIRIRMMTRKQDQEIDLRDKMEVFHRKYRFHFPHPVDIAAMEKAAEYLMGTHDFSAFTDLKEDKDTVRTIYAVGIVYEKDTLTLSWIGDGFLYHMVRILTGTLLDVGIGKIKAEEIPEILKAKDRKKSGFPAPAKGLFLGRVFYTEAELKKAVQKIGEK